MTFKCDATNTTTYNEALFNLYEYIMENANKLANDKKVNITLTSEELETMLEWLEGDHETLKTYGDYMEEEKYLRKLDALYDCKHYIMTYVHIEY